jgi:hypothetical protein
LGDTILAAVIVGTEEQVAVHTSTVAFSILTSFHYNYSQARAKLPD